MIIQIGIGVVVGVLFGAVAVWVLDRRHQNTVAKLVESRRKLERQRTQAVNDLFAFKAEAATPNTGGDAAQQSVAQQAAIQQSEQKAHHFETQNNQLMDEVESLRALVGRADSALAAARAQRDTQEQQIAQLRAQVEVFTGDRAEVIDLHPSPADQYRYGGVV